MNYLLTKENFYILPSRVDSIYDTIYSLNKVPENIISMFNRNGYVIHRISEHKLPKDIIILEGSNEKWPKDSELNIIESEMWKKPILVNNNNIINSFNTIIQNPYTIAYYTELDDKYVDMLGNIVTIKKLDNNTNLYGNKLIQLPEDTNEVHDESYNPNAEILHFNYELNNRPPVYRRFKLKEYLLSNYEINYVSNNDSSLEKLSHKYKVIICSDPRNTELILNKAEKDGSFLVYDRSDNWDKLEHCDLSVIDKKLMDSCDLLICSASSMYNRFVSEYPNKIKLITNGSLNYEFQDVKKYDVPTVAYCGIGSDKIDWEFVLNLANTNKDFNFIFYGVQEPIRKDYPNNIKFYRRLSEEDLHKELCKCHIGLIPFIKTDWTDGMFPLKLFNYMNACIPILYQNCNACKAFSDVAFDSNQYLLNDLLDINIDKDTYLDYVADHTWNSKFNEMLMYIINNINLIKKEES